MRADISCSSCYQNCFHSITSPLFYIAKSKGIEKVAKKANLNRESFYKMFKENSKPRFESIFKVVNALDIKLVPKANSLCATNAISPNNNACNITTSLFI